MAAKVKVTIGYAVLVGGRVHNPKPLMLGMACDLAAELRRRGTHDVKVVSRRSLLADSRA